MGFTKKVWKARQGTGLNKFSIDGKPAATLVNIPDIVTAPGDAFSVENMNDLEDRIAEALGTVYGVRIDRSNSNPDTSVTYTDAATGFAPSRGNNGNFLAGSWGDKYPFNKIRPCLLKDGVVVGYLNPNNYAQFADGTVADITSGNAGDVMVEIPKFYFKISQDTGYTYVQVSNNEYDKVVNGFTDIAFSYKGEIKDKFYVGAYLGFLDINGNLRSISGQTPASEHGISYFRTAAQANGAGYEQLNFYKLTALQVLYLIRYKSLDSQNSLGLGCTNGSSASTTGATDANGMNFGTASGTERIKCNGVESFWGEMRQWVDGYKCVSSTVIKTADGNFNNTADGYEEHEKTPSSGVGHIKDVVGNNALGFTPHVFSGSTSTYYTDYGELYSGRFPSFGGNWAATLACGAFFFDCGRTQSDMLRVLGARLMYCG